MTAIFNPNMVTLAREKRGMTQAELAGRLGVTNGVVSKIEAGLYLVSDNLVDRLGVALEYPRNFFYEDGHVNPLGIHFYRKAKGIPQKILGMINAEINIESIRIPKLLASADLPDNKVPYCELDDIKYNSPEDVARAIRAAWKLPSGPITNAIDILEAHGVLVVDCDFATRLFDADSIVLKDGRSVIFENSNQTSDRMRFSRCHELGHIIMHRIPHDLVEDQANRFAAEFLMPEHDIKSDLRYLSIEKLAHLKRYWRVSMQAILFRAKTLKTITPNQADYLWKIMSKMGWRLQEPPALDPPIEKAILIQEVIALHLKELGYTQDELRGLLNLSLAGDDDKKYFSGENIVNLRLLPRVHPIENQPQSSTKNHLHPPKKRRSSN